MDYTIMYDAVYETYGVESVLTLPGTDGEVIELLAIDITSAFDARDSGLIATPQVNGLNPGAAIRVSDVPAITDWLDLDDAILEMNDKTWRVMSSLPKPSPNGEASGERYLYLIGVTNGSA